MSLGSWTEWFRPARLENTRLRRVFKHHDQHHHDDIYDHHDDRDDHNYDYYLGPISLQGYAL